MISKVCFVVAAVIIITGLILAVAGCNEVQQTKVWGQGDLPSDWQGFFGESNTARLDFVQTRTLNRQSQIIIELMARVRKLEDPNEAVTKKE